MKNLIDIFKEISRLQFPNAKPLSFQTIIKKDERIHKIKFRIDPQRHQVRP